MKPLIPILNPSITGAKCLRCNHNFLFDDYFCGCQKCLKEKYPASLILTYSKTTLNQPFIKPFSMGEGSTPLIELKSIARHLNIKYIFLKDEGANPTGSHKDRFSALLVSRALNKNYGKVIAASSGNAGLSVATYAAAAKLKATIVSTTDLFETYITQIVATGAELVLKTTPHERWAYVADSVKQGSCYPATNFINPPVGSPFIAVEAYKKIAYELAEQIVNTSPPVIIVPTSRGDLIWGIWMGFKELFALNKITRLPRMVVVEPFPRISCVMKGADYRDNFEGEAGKLFSIGGNTVTYQAHLTVTESNGVAVVVSNKQADHAKHELQALGIQSESSSATALAALYHLALTKQIEPNDNVILINTSNGCLEPY